MVLLLKAADVVVGAMDGASDGMAEGGSVGAGPAVNEKPVETRAGGSDTGHWPDMP